MSENNTTTMEPVTKTRKPRTKKEQAPHIVEVKKAVSAALRSEWTLQRAIEQHAKLVKESRRNVELLIEAAREAWQTVQARSVDCANAHVGQF